MLDCSNGHQDGAHCVCDEGWTSSGIHDGNVLTFYWCDMEKVDPSTTNLRPRRLHWLQEAAIVTVSYTPVPDVQLCTTFQSVTLTRGEVPLHSKHSLCCGVGGCGSRAVVGTLL